jgi:HEAT repeat protein
LVSKREFVDSFPHGVIEMTQFSLYQSFGRIKWSAKLLDTYKKSRKLNQCLKKLRIKNSSEVRCAAVLALRDLNDPRAVQPLIATIKDDDPYVSAAAARALGEIHDPRAIQPLIDALEFRPDPPGGSYLTKYDPARRAASDALVMFGVPAAQELAKPIVRSIPRTTTDWKWVTLVAIGGPVANDAMLRILSYEVKSGGVSHNAIESAVDVLSKSGDRRAIDPLVYLLDSKEYRYPEIAASGLKRLGWGEGSASERIALAIAEERFLDAAQEGEAAVASLLAKLSANLDHEMYTANQHWRLNGAGEALVQIGKPAVKPLVEVLIEGESYKRHAAAMALGQIGSVDAVEPLIDALGDSSQGDIEHHSDFRHVETIVHMEGQFVAQAASLALERILEHSAVDVEDSQLARIAALEVVDIWQETISSHCSIYHNLVHGVDNSHIKQLARQELFRRGFIT